MIRKQSYWFASSLLIGFLAACNGAPPQTAPEAPKVPQARTTALSPHKEAPHWDYDADGPAKWGALSPKWALCGTGGSQSPIDIEKTAKADLPALRAEFKPAALRIVHHEHMADVINTGHSVQVNYTEGDTLKVGNEEFRLLQYHFHSPSEHTVAGKQFPMEMHMVHQSTDGKLAVVGVLIEEGRHNAAFDPVWSNLPSSRSMEHHLEHLKVDVNNLLPKKKTTYRYDGSLTTPPCSEGVKWIVMATPIELSSAQILAFRKVMNGNSRPVQSLNGRKIATDEVAERIVR